MTQNAFAFAASAMIPIGQASTAGNLTFKSTATIVAKEGISMGAGAGAQKITTDVTGNDTAGMVAGMVASGMTAKGLNGIEAEANKLAKAPKGIDGVTEGAGNLAEDVGKVVESGINTIDMSMYTELSNAEVADILKTRGLDEGAINDLLTSFDGPIYKRIGYEGEIFTITESKVGDASGVFVTRGSAGSTPTERINNLALPPNNSASIESQVELTRAQILLEGKVAPQREWALIANDGIPRTGGAWQVVTDGGKYSNAIRR